MNSKVCFNCGRRGSHEDCHISYDKPKSYKQYLKENKYHTNSIISRYGASKEAKPPGYKEVTDAQFRKQYSRINYMKKGSTFHLKFSEQDIINGALDKKIYEQA